MQRLDMEHVSCSIIKCFWYMFCADNVKHIQTFLEFEFWDHIYTLLPSFAVIVRLLECDVYQLSDKSVFRLN